jgi:hypothetical protein
MTTKNSETMIAIALGAVAALIMVAGLALLVLPQRSHAHRLDGDVTSAQSQLVSARAAAAAPAASPVKVDAADLFRVAEAMPDTDRMPQILTELSALAGESSVQLTSVKPSTAVPMLGYSALPLSINVSGAYANLSAFSRRLHDAVVVSSSGRLRVSGRLFIVNGIQLSSSNGRTVSATMNVDAFDYVPAAPVVPGTSTTPTTTGAST